MALNKKPYDPNWLFILCYYTLKSLALVFTSIMMRSKTCEPSAFDVIDIELGTF